MYYVSASSLPYHYYYYYYYCLYVYHDRTSLWPLFLSVDVLFCPLTFCVPFGFRL
jgi:hypothetical protein